MSGPLLDISKIILQKNKKGLPNHFQPYLKLIPLTSLKNIYNFVQELRHIHIFLPKLSTLDIKLTDGNHNKILIKHPMHLFFLT